jgi:hypothetical protein
MTGAQTLPIQTPPFETAATLILRVALLLFQKATHKRGLDDAAFLAWSTLRRTASHFLSRSSICLTNPERECLIKALMIAHSVAHPEGEHSPAQSCGCEMGRAIWELASFMEETEAR